MTYWPLLTSINHYQLLLTSKLTEAAGMGGTLRWCAPEVLGGDEQRHGWATAVYCHSWMMYCDIRYIRDEHLPSVLTFTIATGFELIAVLNRFDVLFCADFKPDYDPFVAEKGLF